MAADLAYFVGLLADDMIMQLLALVLLLVVVLVGRDAVERR